MEEKYFNEIVSKIEPYIIESHFYLSESHSIFEYEYEDKIYGIRLSYLRYMIFYKKSSCGSMITKMQNTDKNFCPIFNFEKSVEEFDAKDFLSNSKLHTESWLI